MRDPNPDKGAAHRKNDPLTEMGYEVENVSLVSLRSYAIGFFIFVVFSWALGWAILYWWMAPDYFRGDFHKNSYRHLPPAPAPLLQSNISVRSDIEKMRDREAEALQSAARGEGGTYRIPIEKAIDKIAERGLPSRPEGPGLDMGGRR